MNNNSQLGVVTPRQCVGSGSQYCAQSGSEVPLFVSGGQTFTMLSSGARHTCALTDAGTAFCWGSNRNGQLGTNEEVPYCSDTFYGQFGPCSAQPMAVASVPPLESISAGAEHTCGLTSAGAAYCWGSGRGGVLGNGGTVNSASPVAVSGGLAFRNISAGFTHTCGVTTDDRAYCWGLNLRGNLGIGRADTLPYTVPQLVSSDVPFQTIATGLFNTCALSTDGAAHCWGGGRMLGVATAPEACSELSGSGWQVEAGPCSTEPTRVDSDLTFGSISLAIATACALTPEGAVHCWTEQLPIEVTGAPALRVVSAGAYGSGCGVTLDDVAYCWNNDRVPKRVPGQP